MKRIICFLLFLSVLSPICLQVGAINSNTVSGIDASVEVLTQAEVQVYFAAKNTASGIQDEIAIERVDYSYSIVRREEDSGLAVVSLDFTIVVEGKRFPVHTEGRVNAYSLSTGEVLWEGALDGEIVIDNENCSVIAGFAKLGSSDDIQVSVTIQSGHMDDARLPLMFTFGENVISADIHQELIGNAKNVPVDLLSEKSQSVRSSSFELIAMASRNFETVDAGDGSATRVYFNSNTNQVAISIRSFCSNLSAYYNQLSTIDVETTIESFKIQMQRADYTDSNYSWIAGIEAFDFDANDFNGGAEFLNLLFEDAMSLIGVPTATISNVLSGLKGSVDEVSYTDLASIEVTFGSTQSANFDDVIEGVPVVFQLSRTYNGSYVGPSVYNTVTSIRYRSYIWYESNNWPRYYYTDAQDTSMLTALRLG